MEMLFRKNIDRVCAHCVHAGKIDDTTCICARRGIVSADGKCHKFKYDPLKRIPVRQKPKDFSACDELDFSL